MLSVILSFFLLIQLQSGEAALQEVEKEESNPIVSQLKKNFRYFHNLGDLNVLFFIDTSGSMREIFPAVKTYLKDFISRCQEDNIITIVSFDSVKRKHVYGEKITETNKSNIIRKINNMEARGKYTDLTLALRSFRETMEDLTQLHPYRRSIGLILSDNLNDPPPNKPHQEVDIRAISKNFRDMLNWQIYVLETKDSDEEMSFWEKITFALSGGEHGTGVVQVPVRRVSDLFHSLIFIEKNNQVVAILQWILLPLILLFFLLWTYRRSILLGLIFTFVLLGCFLVFPELTFLVMRTAMNLLLFPFRLLQAIFVAFYHIHPISVIIPGILLLLLLYILYRWPPGYQLFHKLLGRDNPKLIEELKSDSIYLRREAIQKIFLKPTLRFNKERYLQYLNHSASENFEIVPARLAPFQILQLVSILKANQSYTAISGLHTNTTIDFINRLIGKDLIPHFKFADCVPIVITHGPPKLTVCFKDGERRKYPYHSLLKPSSERGGETSQSPRNLEQFFSTANKHNASLYAIEISSPHHLLKKKGVFIAVPPSQDLQFQNWLKVNCFYPFIDRILLIHPEGDKNINSLVVETSVTERHPIPLHIGLWCHKEGKACREAAIELRDSLRSRTGLSTLEAVPFPAAKDRAEGDSQSGLSYREDMEFFLSVY